MASTSGWVSSSYVKEVERLSHLLWHYETVNVDQKQQLVHYQSAQEGYLVKLQQEEIDKKKLQKQVKGLEISLKFEKIAEEGLRKKAALLEKETIDLTEKAQKLNSTITDLEEKRAKLEHELQEERAYRLQLVHEKERVVSNLEQEHAQLQTTENDNTHAHTRLLEALQRLEVLEERNTRQEKLVSFQANEIVNLNSEVFHLRENNMIVQRQLLEEQQNHAQYYYIMDKLQEEISYLRQQLMTHATNNSEKSLLGYQPNDHKRRNKLKAEVNKMTSERYEVSSFRVDRTFSQRNANALTHNNSNNIPPPAFLSSEMPLHQLPSVDRHHIASKTQSQSLSPLATRDRPTSSLDAAKLDYFDDPDREALLDWIRTASRHTSRQGTANTHSTATENKSAELDQQQAAINNDKKLQSIQQLYSSANKPSSVVSHGHHKGFSQSMNQSSRSLAAGSSSTVIMDQHQQQQHLSQHSMSSAPAGLTPGLGFGNSSGFETVDQAHHKTTKKSNKIKTNKHSSHSYENSDRRSLFIGSGLHYKPDADLDQELRDLQKGSTKQILARILGTS